MMSFVVSLLGGAGARVYGYAAVALGVLLVLLGFYRAGLRSAEAAATRQAIDQVRKNQLTKEAVDEEIRRADVAGRDARERMRSEWYRD